MGKVVDFLNEVKKAMIDANPFLQKNYSIDDENFAVFYIDKMKANLSSFTGESIEIEN